MGVGGAEEDNGGGEVEQPEGGQVGKGREGERSAEADRQEGTRQSRTCLCWDTFVYIFVHVCPERAGRKYICLIGTQHSSNKSFVS